VRVAEARFPASELPSGARRIVTVGGLDVGVFNVGGELFALQNRCPHQWGPVCEGPLVGALSSSEPGRYDYLADQYRLRCPWHGWEFDIRTGHGWTSGKARVRRFYPRREHAEIVVSSVPA
jgi:3-phenylpropionate/trans-cinnamate dioxygenase ferredoxin subunit